MSRFRHERRHEFFADGSSVDVALGGRTESCSHEPARIEHDPEDICVVEGDAKLFAEGFLKFADKSGVRSKLALLPKLVELDGRRQVFGVWLSLDRGGDRAGTEMVKDRDRGVAHSNQANST